MYNLMEEVILPSILSVEDLAYVEEAKGTLGMLKLIEQIIRYNQQHRLTIFLGIEVDTIRAILELYRYRFGSFQYKIEWDEKYKYLEVEKYSVVQQAMQIIREKLKVARAYSQLDLIIQIEEDKDVQVLLRR